MKKKVCKNCKIFVDTGDCPICKNSNFTTNWQGRIVFIDTKNSMIAHKIGTEISGEYAIKAR
jgi:DNA-directed RNA polymerase subunit E"